MKKSLLYYLAAALFMGSCTNELEDSTVVPQENGTVIQVTAEEFQPQTRTTISETTDGYYVGWTRNDQLGVFPMQEDGNQIAFVNNRNIGSTVSFTSEGWKLKEGATYAAYYPLNPDVQQDKTQIPLDYSGQVQTDNSSTKHLGTYDYMISSPATVEDGTANFSFKHLGALLKIDLDMPESNTWKSIRLHSTGAQFVEKATVDLTTGQVTATRKTNSITLELKNVLTKYSNKHITAYMMIGVDENSINYTTGTLTAWVTDAAGKEYVTEVNGVVAYKGRYYSIASKDNEALVPVEKKVAKLVDGDTFNGRLKSLVIGSQVSVSEEDRIIESISFKTNLSVVPTEDMVLVSADDSPCKAYAAWRKSDNAILIVSDAYRYEVKSSCCAMFSGFKKLKSLDLTNLATSKVISMDAMFNNCFSLQTLDLSNFDTSKVTDMHYMFYNCSSLQTLDLSSFDTSKVTDMFSMFSGCGNMTDLNLNRFKMDAVSRKSGMFTYFASDSGHCTITCPASVRTALSTGTGLVTSRITWK